VNMNELSEAALDWYDEQAPDGAAYLMGHSIGLQVEDRPPVRHPGRAGHGLRGEHGARNRGREDYRDTRLGVEDLYIVTKDGCRKLSSLTPDIHEIT